MASEENTRHYFQAMLRGMPIELVRVMDRPLADQLSRRPILRRFMMRNELDQLTELNQTTKIKTMVHAACELGKDDLLFTLGIAIGYGLRDDEIAFNDVVGPIMEGQTE